MHLISEKTAQEIGRLPHRLDPLSDATSIGIDLVDVAESHVLLFGRVKDFVHGEAVDAPADLDDLAQECELGRWLKGEGASRFGQLHSFGRLHEAHADFHRQALDVLAKIHTGSWIAAEHMRKSELARALRRVLIALTELNDSINKLAWRLN